MRFRRLTLTAFLVVTLFGIIVGGVDAATARGLAPRLFGVYLLIVGLLAAAALIGLRDVLFPRAWPEFLARVYAAMFLRGTSTPTLEPHNPRESTAPTDSALTDTRPSRWAAWPAAIASGLVLATGIAAALAGGRGYVDLRHMAFAGAAVVTGIVMVLSVLGYPPHWPPAWASPKGETPPRSVIEILKDAFGILGVVGIAGAAVAFWYTNLYQPGTQLPAVNVAVSLEQTSSGQTSAIHATVTAKNASSFRVRVVSSYFDLVSEDVGSGYKSESVECSVRAEMEGDLTFPLMHWPDRVGRGAFTTVDAGTIFPEGWFMEPGEEQTFGFIAPLPMRTTPDPYVVRAFVRLHLARGDRVGTSGSWFPRSPDWDKEAIAPPAGDPSSECVHRASLHHMGSAVWPLIEESTFNWLTRDPLELWSDWFSRGDGWIESYTKVYEAGGPSLTAGFGSDEEAVTRLLHLWGSMGTQTVEELLVH